MRAAVSGAALTFAIYISAAIPVIGLLIALLVGISLLIEYFKDNPVQDWLERSPWGILVNQRFPDFETEHAQLQQAFKD
jgi:peptidoglycan/LPS O-acetylase OafA/YrhL